MGIPNIGPWPTNGELLVTTGYAIMNSSEELVDLIRDLHYANAVGLAIKTRLQGDGFYTSQKMPQSPFY